MIWGQENSTYPQLACPSIILASSCPTVKFCWFSKHPLQGQEALILVLRCYRVPLIRASQPASFCLPPSTSWPFHPWHPVIMVVYFLLPFQSTFSLLKFLEHCFHLVSLKWQLEKWAFYFTNERRLWRYWKGGWYYFVRGMRDRLEEKSQNVEKPVRRLFNDGGRVERGRQRKEAMNWSSVGAGGGEWTCWGQRDSRF